MLHSTRELLYYETDTGSTLLGHIELGSHVVVKAANNHRDAPYPKGGIDIQTQGARTSYVWKLTTPTR